MIGDIFSGITGNPPKSLLDLKSSMEILKNTSIDPTPSGEGISNSKNVDLQCVYKASIDGWSAVDFHRCCDERGTV